MNGAIAWYAYAVLPDGALLPTAEPVLPDASFELVRATRVAVLASPVPRALFDRDDPANQAGDPAWIGARAHAHHGVAAAAAAAGACLPLAFGALFASRDSLGTWVEARQAGLERALARVAGRAEWAVRLHEDAEAHAAWLDLHDPDLQALAARIAAASSGTGFLLERRQAQARSAARAAHLAAAGREVAVALAGNAGLVEQQAACWTVLADAAERQLLEAALAPLAQAWEGNGLMLALSGPWPPYAFAREALTDA
jgi:hypothetical protein